MKAFCPIESFRLCGLCDAESSGRKKRFKWESDRAQKAIFHALRKPFDFITIWTVKKRRWRRKKIKNVRWKFFSFERKGEIGSQWHTWRYYHLMASYLCESLFIFCCMTMLFIQLSSWKLSLPHTVGFMLRLSIVQRNSWWTQAKWVRYLLLTILYHIKQTLFADYRGKCEIHSNSSWFEWHPLLKCEAKMKFFFITRTSWVFFLFSKWCWHSI